jgi:hypothetical protein
MRGLDAVLDHEEPLPHPTCDQVQERRRIISAASSCVGAMSPGQWVYQVRGHHGGRTERDLLEHSAYVRSAAHYGLKSDIAPSPKSATRRHGPHSITSSARAKTAGGSSMPPAFGYARVSLEVKLRRAFDGQVGLCRLHRGRLRAGDAGVSHRHQRMQLRQPNSGCATPCC